jgi:hypothetical protein
MVVSQGAVFVLCILGIYRLRGRLFNSKWLFGTMVGICALVISTFVRSTIGCNDLGMRAIMPYQVGSALVAGAGVVALVVLIYAGPRLGRGLIEAVRAGLRHLPVAELEPHSAQQLLSGLFTQGLDLLGWFLGALFFAALGATVAQVGFAFVLLIGAGLLFAETVIPPDIVRRIVPAGPRVPALPQARVRHALGEGRAAFEHPRATRLRSTPLPPRTTGAVGRPWIFFSTCTWCLLRSFSVKMSTSSISAGIKEGSARNCSCRPGSSTM